LPALEADRYDFFFLYPFHNGSGVFAR